MKTFLAVWGDGYTKQGSEEVTEDFFREEIGYRQLAIEKIKELQVNQSVDLTDPSGVHYVIRTS